MTLYQSVETLQIAKHILVQMQILDVFHRFCMVYSEVPNFSEPNPDLLAKAKQQNKTVSQVFFLLM